MGTAAACVVARRAAAGYDPASPGMHPARTQPRPTHPQPTTPHHTKSHQPQPIHTQQDDDDSEDDEDEDDEDESDDDDEDGQLLDWGAAAGGRRQPSAVIEEIEDVGKAEKKKQAAKQNGKAVKGKQAEEDSEDDEDEGGFGFGRDLSWVGLMVCVV